MVTVTSHGGGDVLFTPVITRVIVRQRLDILNKQVCTPCSQAELSELGFYLDISRCCSVDTSNSGSFHAETKKYVG